MFDAHVFLAGRAEFVERPSRFATSDGFDYDRAGESARAIMAGFDSLGLGDWQYVHTGGGCFAYSLTFDDGCYLLVTDPAGPLSDVGDSDDFSSGGVLVGFYPPDDFTEGLLWVLVTSPFTDDGDPDYAIVATVGEILQATGVTDGGVSWSSLARFVAGAVCASCDGSGWHGFGTERETPCGCRRWKREALTWSYSGKGRPVWARS